MKLSDEQKRKIIEKAQELYRDGFDVRCQQDPVLEWEVNLDTFKEACYEMSCLVHYLAEKMYGIPKEENLIYHCIFKCDKKEWSHFFNKICGRIVDSSIMQFGDFSPYDNHDDCYTNLERHEYSDNTIKYEIQLYEDFCLLPDVSLIMQKSKKKRNWFTKIRSIISK